jgi:serine/threonine-protein kinase RsbW
MWTLFADSSRATTNSEAAASPSVNDTHQMFAVRRVEQIVPFVDTIAAALCRLGYSPRQIRGVRLALEEAIVNGIRHGNKSDPSKCVQVSYQLRPEESVFAVQDEGAGFDCGMVPDPTLPENLSRPSGRGLLLMRHYMTAVQFSHSGKRVTMTRTRVP